MTKKYNTDQDHIEKLTSNFLSNLGYEHTKNICKEYDEKSQEINSILVPQDLDQWFNSFIKTNKRESFLRHIKEMTLFSRKGVAIVLFFILISTTFLALNVEAFRIRFFNLIIQVRDQFTSVSVNEENNSNYYKSLPKEWNEFYYPTFIPKGFVFESARGSNNKRISFVNQDKKEIIFYQAENGTDFQLDTENAKTMEVDINGTKGLLIDKEGQVTLFWYNSEVSFYIRAELDKGTLYDIAKSVIKNK